jgi:hypothetical protein
MFGLSAKRTQFARTIWRGSRSCQTVQPPPSRITHPARKSGCLIRDIRRKIQESVELAFEIPFARASQIPYQSTVGLSRNDCDGAIDRSPA